MRNSTVYLTGMLDSLHFQLSSLYIKWIHGAWSVKLFVLTCVPGIKTYRLKLYTESVLCSVVIKNLGLNIDRIIKWTWNQAYILAGCTFPSLKAKRLVWYKVIQGLIILSSFTYSNPNNCSFYYSNKMFDCHIVDCAYFLHWFFLLIVCWHQSGISMALKPHQGILKSAATYPLILGSYHANLI